MILSGDKVLFLNPSKMHLPFEDWASLLVPLSQMQRYASQTHNSDNITDLRPPFFEDCIPIISQLWMAFLITSFLRQPTIPA